MAYSSGAIQLIKNKFYNLKWHEVYDFIEFFLNEFQISHKKDFIENLNKIFEEERAPYRIIEDLITPLTSEEEIEEIKKSLGIPDQYQPARNHLKKALEFYSKRPDPKPKKAIEESILALEALARIITGKESATLVDLTKELPLHPALREGLNKIYGWTSDEGGIRHAEKQYPPISAGGEEARFMLVLSSAFVNYIIAKYEKSKS